MEKEQEDRLAESLRAQEKLRECVEQLDHAEGAQHLGASIPAGRAPEVQRAYCDATGLRRPLTSKRS